MAKKEIDTFFSYSLSLFQRKNFLLKNISFLYTKPLLVYSIIIVFIMSIFKPEVLSIAIGLLSVYIYQLVLLNKTKRNIRFDKLYKNKTKEEETEKIEYIFKNPSETNLSNIIIYDNFDGTIDRKGDTSYIKNLNKLCPRDTLKKTRSIVINNGMGKKAIGPTSFQLTDELGIHRLTVHFNDVDFVEVFPKVFPTKHPEVIPSLQNTTFGVYDTKSRGNNVNFYCAKEYQTGDNVKQINWKLSLKSNKLIVNQFENNSNAELNILLIDDQRLHFGSGSINSFEYCKDLLLSLCHAHISSNNKVGLVSHQKCILAKSGKRHLNAMELEIAKLEPHEFSSNQLFHRKKVHLPELTKLNKHVKVLTQYSKDVFVFSGFIPGKLWDLYFQMLSDFSRSGIKVHLIITIGYNTISNDVGQEDKVWLRTLQAELKTELKNLRDNCKSARINLSILDIDSNEEYKKKIRRGFEYEKLSN